MTKEKYLELKLKKARLESQVLKTENSILKKLNANSDLPLCMNEFISNLKKQNRILEQENKRLLKIINNIKVTRS